MATSKVAKWVGILTMLAGALLIVVGGITWGVITSQLKQERITISADAKWFPGRQVTGPLTAYSQAQVIQAHAMKSSDGLSYAELGAKATEARNAGNIELADELTKIRTSVMNGSLLRGSLFTSVLAYGVAAFAAGVGVVFLLIGFALQRPLVANTVSNE